MKNELKNFHKKTGMFLFGKELVDKRKIKIKKTSKENFQEQKIKNVLENIPKGATHIYRGYFFKIGIHGFTFIFTNNEWKRTEEIILRNNMRI